MPQIVPTAEGHDPDLDVVLVQNWPRAIELTEKGGHGLGNHCQNVGAHVAIRLVNRGLLERGDDHRKGCVMLPAHVDPVVDPGSFLGGQVALLA